MNGKGKFLVVLGLALLVSAVTSYATTWLYISTLPSTTPSINDLSPQALQGLADEIVELSRTNVSLPFRVQYLGLNDGIVVVNGCVALENLTIVYRYTRLDDGSTVVQSVDYGSFFPAWGAGVIIEAGLSPSANFRIPHEILQACIATKMNDYGDLVFDGEPKLEVLGVYGYA